MIQMLGRDYVPRLILQIAGVRSTASPNRREDNQWSYGFWLTNKMNVF